MNDFKYQIFQVEPSKSIFSTPEYHDNTELDITRPHGVSYANDQQLPIQPIASVIIDQKENLSHPIKESLDSGFSSISHPTSEMHDVLEKDRINNFEFKPARKFFNRIQNQKQEGQEKKKGVASEKKGIPKSEDAKIFRKCC